MSISEDFPAWTRLRNRWAAWRASINCPTTTFVTQPEPRTIGSPARGRQLMAGDFLFAGHLLQAPDTNMWDLPSPSHAFTEAMHGFGWLDDLAASDASRTRAVAQDWLWSWIKRYEKGKGPGWTPDLTGRRLIRWINHAVFLLNGRDGEQSHRFHNAMAAQTIFLSQRWSASPLGLPRFEALTGLIYAGLALEGMEDHIAPAVEALDKECIAQIDQKGGLLTRNPEQLLEVFTLLTWAALALSERGYSVRTAHWSAVERIAPTLRTLRHADGGLARFHGGGRGLEGRLDHALANCGVKTRQSDGLSMGYARLSASRTSVIVDASPPPNGVMSGNAHASTLAFELTSGRRPVIVSCGSGVNFGLEWRRIGRATRSHSTLTVSDRSSAELGPVGRSGLEYLINTPQSVPIEMSHATGGHVFEGGHDGYIQDFGLTHARKLELAFDGRSLVGEDMLLAQTETEKARFDRVLDATTLQGIPYHIRFHLHPTVDASIDMGGTAVSLELPSGEIWILRANAELQIDLEQSFYLDKTHLNPRATKQIVLSGRMMEYAIHVKWSLAKPEDSPVGIRDLAQGGV